MDFKSIVGLGQETWKQFQDDEAMNMSAGLSYYALFSLFPLLLLLTAVLGFALNYFPAAQDSESAILSAVSSNFSPELASILSDVFDGVQEQAGAATGIGLVTLLLGASGVFQQLDTSFNRIWRVPKKEGGSIIDTIREMVMQKLSAFAMVLGVGVLLIVSAALTGIAQALLTTTNNFIGISPDSWLAGAAGIVLSTLIGLALNTVIFALLYKFLPAIKIPWGDVWLGALFTSVVWEIAKRLLAIYIGRMGESNAAYGAIGSVLVVVAWVYFSSLILYLGAEFTKVFSLRHGSRKDETLPDEQPVIPAEPEPAPDLATMPGYTSSLRKATGKGFVIGALSGLATAVATVIAAGVFAVMQVNRALRKIQG